ncbi:MAG: substrate-binding domain-containing protein [Pirellulales bacterium]|nr:substrate-binding domain-containing protein [Pirellulales bacterium]
MHPHRPKLADQVAAELQAAIATGRWTEWLPQERQLAVEFRVSRTTLREALSRLIERGLIQSRAGEGHRLVRKKRPPAAAAPRHVNLLMPEDMRALRPGAARWIDELRGKLAERGETLRLVESRAAFSGRPANALRRLVQHDTPACWVLQLSTQPMQEWFASHKLPCVVVGTCFKGMNLPFVDRDHHAACRHAVGRLVAAGHRRIALLVPAAQKAGDVESETGFRAGTEAAGLGDAVVVLRLPGDTATIDRTLGRLLSADPAPTALLTTQPEIYLTAFSSLAHRRLRVPDDVSLVCCAHDRVLDHLVPQPTGYRIAWQTFAARVVRLVVEVSERRLTAPIGHLILPEFVPGASLRTIRGS